MTTTIRSARLSAAAMAMAIALALAPAPAPAVQEAQLPLQVELGLKVQTPTRLAGGMKTVAFPSPSMTVNLGFGDVSIAAVVAGRGFALELDLDGDGRIAPGERVPVAPNGAATLTFTRPGDPGKTAYRVLFTHVEASADHNKAVTRFSAQIHPDFAWRATLGKTVVRLIDANLDGKLTQDGRDAIAIGASDLALPLLKRHYIDGREYDLTLAPDASSLTAVAYGDAEHGRVALPLRASVLKHFVLRSDTQAYDVVANPMIPPDTYKLVVGVLAQGSESVVLAPGPAAMAYPVKPGFVNLLRLGPPLAVTFTGSVDKKGVLTVHPPSAILGLGGERYIVQYPSASRPAVTLTAAGRVMSSAPMPLDKTSQPTSYTDRVGGLADNWLVELRIPIPCLSLTAVGQKSVGDLPIDVKPTPPPASATPPPAPAPVRYQPLPDKPTTRP